MSSDREALLALLNARQDLDYYRDFMRSRHPEDTVFNGVELNRDQMAVVLQIHDYGIEGIGAEEKQLLYAVIAELKDHIHP